MAPIKEGHYRFGLRCPPSERAKVMMPSTINLKQEERNWLDLPYDVMANVLNRIGMVDIIENAEKVCTAWLKICKDSALWKVIDMNDLLRLVTNCSATDICRLAVDRSQGQLVDITLAYAYDVTLLEYVSERYVRLRLLG
ncbi:F-box protein SKIP19-like [Bidens hawaiensis]|uniref:F-box protein SKIP19-like n=1 Tax=Bidens hawaiensis TaxID=980011 RepID=UPI004049B2CC